MLATDTVLEEEHALLCVPKRHGALKVVYVSVHEHDLPELRIHDRQDLDIQRPEPLLAVIDLVAEKRRALLAFTANSHAL